MTDYWNEKVVPKLIDHHEIRVPKHLHPYPLYRNQNQLHKESFVQNVACVFAVSLTDMCAAVLVRVHGQQDDVRYQMLM